MPTLIPASVNYPSPLNAVPTTYRREPPEGPHMIPMEVDWGIMGGANNCVFANFQNNATMNISQIVALSVDNSQCGGDVRFIFPDTTETITIPAYSPKTIIEVFTNMTQFYVLGQNVQTGDVTSFSVHNTLPPPVSVSITKPQNVAANSAINANVNATVALVPNTVSGTINALYVNDVISQQTVHNNRVNWAIVDGLGKTIASGIAGGSFLSQVNDVLISADPLNVRFQNGLNFVTTNTTLDNGGIFMTNIYYTVH